MSRARVTVARKKSIGCITLSQPSVTAESPLKGMYTSSGSMPSFALTRSRRSFISVGAVVKHRAPYQWFVELSMMSATA